MRGNTVALPPPSTRASLASAPIRATLESVAGSSGSSGVRGQHERARGDLPRQARAVDHGRAAGPAARIPGRQPARRRALRAAAHGAPARRRRPPGPGPSRTAATSLSPHGLPIAGIAMSSPPLAAPDGVASCEPVGHDRAVEGPLVLEHAALERRVIGHRHSVDAVVCRHDAPGARRRRRSSRTAPGTARAACARSPRR